MFFLHSMEVKRGMMEEAGDTDGLERLPLVDVFEKRSEPGGVWKANRDFTQDESTDDTETANMYEALWTNAPKESIEFYDYTFEDHFGDVDLPLYMPRQAILEYFTARVMRKNPNIFENVHFSTTVISVKYNKDRKKFVVTTRNNRTKEKKITEYDKCVWAAGLEGKPNIPEEVDNVLRKESFRGNIIHSSKVGNFTKYVENKRILLVGDSLSAEDLALQAIKLGVERVYISSRSGGGAAMYHAAWPYNKVEIIEKMNVTSVIQDGLGIRLTFPNDSEVLDLNNIATVVYCTGYTEEDDMLDQDLQIQVEKEYTPYTMPLGWKMKNNVLTEYIGVDIEPHPEIKCCLGYIYMDLYRNLLISNPSMFYISHSSAMPLFETDVYAWMSLSYIMGDIEIPTEEEMRRQNDADVLDLMEVIEIRYLMDHNYAAVNDALNEEGKEHWSWDITDPRTLQSYMEQDKYHIKIMARDMRDSKYPLDIGTYEKLNKKGLQLVENNKEG